MVSGHRNQGGTIGYEQTYNEGFWERNFLALLREL
jgi:hypothetical protein